MRQIISPVSVFAVGATWAQVTWGDLPPGPITFQAGDSRETIDHGGGPGSNVVDGLVTGTPFEVRVTDATGQDHRATGTTLEPPPGQLLSRFATISDLHLGARRWGFLKTMSEPPGQFPEPHPVRCAAAAIQEAVAWGAELLLIKGDAVQHEDDACFEMLGELVDRFPDLPMMLVPGNHDVDAGATVIPTTVGSRKLPYIRSVDYLDLPGARIVMANSTRPSAGSGTLAGTAGTILEVAADTSDPLFLGLHHQLQPGRIPRYWPKGIVAPESTLFLDRLADSTDKAVVSSGHTHRNRARMHRQILLTEVSSTKDWPGTWGAYSIYEGGISQSVRRIGEPSAMVWTEYSQQAVLGLWSKWSPGRMEDRCLSHVWARDPHLVG